MASDPNRVTIIGWDCATQPKLNGIAVASWSAGSQATVELLDLPKNETRLMACLAEALEREQRVLIAADVPLGWPATSSKALSGHRAGQGIAGSGETFFRRRTDRVIAERFGNKPRPMEVNASWLGRTAWQTLRRIETLRSMTGHVLPLDWQDDSASKTLIEVYPASMRKVLGLPNKSKAKPRELVEQLPLRLTNAARNTAAADEHAMDAMLCVLAGVAFLEGRAIGPTAAEFEDARREGWIWSAAAPVPDDN